MVDDDDEGDVDDVDSKARNDDMLPGGGNAGPFFTLLINGSGIIGPIRLELFAAAAAGGGDITSAPD